MANINTALIAFIGVLVGGYLNNFLAEDYRRFRDGTAMAGALAGELNSHLTAFPLLRQMLTGIASVVDRGEQPRLREIPIPTDPVFDSAVTKLGLVGHELAEEVAFAYQQIRAFRINFDLILRSHDQMESDELLARLKLCMETIDRGEPRALKLVADLKSYASQDYLSSWAWVRRLRMLAAESGVATSTKNASEQTKENA